MLSRIFSFLFEDVKETPTPPEGWNAQLATASPADKRALAADKRTPPAALIVMAQDSDADLRTLLTTRLANLLPDLDVGERDEAYRLTVQALQHLTEDHVTSVRVALASALKDIASTPNGIARTLAADAERAVAEPILRYSLSLSDEDLLEVIAQYPHGWQTISIAGRRVLSTRVSEAVAITENTDAGTALLANDHIKLSMQAMQLLQRQPQLQQALHERTRFRRRWQREWNLLTERALYVFLRRTAQLDRATAKEVLHTIKQRVTSQDVLAATAPIALTEAQLTDALSLGEHDIVMASVAAKAAVPVAVARKMLLDAASPRAVMALAVKAGLSPVWAVACQQKLSRIPPTKLLYPLQGDKVPMTAAELQWQYEFYGIN